MENMNNPWKWKHSPQESVARHLQKGRPNRAQAQYMSQKRNFHGGSVMSWSVSSSLRVRTLVTCHPRQVQKWHRLWQRNIASGLFCFHFGYWIYHWFIMAYHLLRCINAAFWYRRDRLTVSSSRNWPARVPRPFRDSMNPSVVPLLYVIANNTLLMFNNITIIPYPTISPFFMCDHPMKFTRYSSTPAPDRWKRKS